MRALVLCLVACLLVQAAPKAAFETLVSLDCTGTFRVFPDSLFSFGTKLNVLDHYNTVMKQVYDRVKCRCPSITDEVFRTRYNPVDVLLNNAVYGQTPEFENDPCLDSMTASFTRDLYKQLKSAYSKIGLQLPESCTYGKYKSTGCLLQFNLPRVNTNLQIAAKSCPNSYLPHFSMHCAGDACNMLKSCNSDADCPASQNCRTLLDTSEMSEENVFNFLRDISLYNETETFSTTKCPKPLTLVENVVRKIKSYWPGSAAGTTLKACALRDGADLQNDLEDLYNKFDGERTETKVVCGDQCAAQPGRCQNGGTCAPLEWDQVTCNCPGNWDGPFCEWENPYKWQWPSYSAQSSSWYGSATAFFKNASNPPLLAWNGVLESGEDAMSPGRLQGQVYAPIVAPPVAAGESHLMGVGCGGDVSLFVTEPYGLTLQFRNAHELGQYVMDQLLTIAQCSNKLTREQFVLNHVPWLPDMWLAKFFSLTDGTLSDVDLVPGSLAQRLFEATTDLTSTQKAKMYIRTKVAHLLGRKASVQEVAQDAKARFVSVVSAPLTALVNKAKPVIFKFGEANPLFQAYTAVATAAARAEHVAKVVQQQQLNVPVATKKNRIGGLSTWDYATWTAKRQIAAKFTAFPDVLGADFDVRFRVEQCPAVSFMLPNAHVTCRGAACDAFHLRVDCNAGKACASGQVCIALANIAPGVYDYDYPGLLLWGGLDSASITQQGSDARCVARNVGPDATVRFAGSCSSLDLWRKDLAVLYKSVTGNSAPLGSGVNVEELQVCVPDISKLGDQANNHSFVESKDLAWGTEYRFPDLYPLENAFPDPAKVSFVLAGNLADWTEEKTDAFKEDVSKLVHVHKNYLTIKLKPGSVTAEVTVAALPDPSAVANQIQTTAASNDQFMKANNVETVVGAAPSESPSNSSFPIAAIIVPIVGIVVIAVAVAMVFVVRKRRSAPAQQQTTYELMEGK